MQPSVPEPVFINLEYFFLLVGRVLGGFFATIFSMQFIQTARVLATILIILLIAYVLYLLVRLHELTQLEEKEQKANQLTPFYEQRAPSGAAAAAGADVQGRNETWEHIRAKLLSENHSEWRVGIIEADIYMDRLLDERGFHGETTSDKLKQITPNALASVGVAWEAHKVRNRIAHDGAAFELTQPEARRVLSYFEIVFRDLGVIA